MRARCPACAEHGGDAHGERHLLIEPDGRFGCCANPGDSGHRRRIWRLAGMRSGIGRRVGESAPTIPPPTVKPFTLPPSRPAVSILHALSTPFSDVSDGTFKPLRVKSEGKNICTRTSELASEMSEDDSDESPHLAGWDRSGRPIYLGTRGEWRNRFRVFPALGGSRIKVIQGLSLESPGCAGTGSRPMPVTAGPLASGSRPSNAAK